MDAESHVGKALDELEKAIIREAAQTGRYYADGHCREYWVILGLVGRGLMAEDSREEAFLATEAGIEWAKLPESPLLELSRMQKAILRHALCGSRGEPFRNWYASCEHCDEYSTLLGLVELGLMRKRGMSGDVLFFVTEAGAAAVGLDLPEW